MGALGELVHHLVELLGRPLDGKVDVLQQHPPAILVGGLEGVHGDVLLSLTERYRNETGGLRLSLGGDPKLGAEFLHAGRHIDTRGKEDEGGDAWLSVLERASKVVRDRLHVVLAQKPRHEGRHSRSETVRAQGPENHEAVQLGHALPIARQGFVLRTLELDPLAPALGRAHEVVRETSKLVDLPEGLDGSPAGIAHEIGDRVIDAQRLRPTQEEVKLAHVEFTLGAQHHDSQLGRHDELVALEEALVDVLIECDARGLNQQLHALLEGLLLVELLVFRDLGLVLTPGDDVDTLVQDGKEVGHAEVVHTVERTQSVNQEVHEGPPRGHGTVRLAGRGDRSLRLLRDLDLLLNVVRSLLRLLKIFNQLYVLQDVALRVGEAEQEVVLELLDRDGVLGKLRAQVCGLLLQIRAFFGDDQAQELVLEPLLRHAEVHNRGLRVDLGLVVGVRELGLKEQTEVGVVLDFLLTHLD